MDVVAVIYSALTCHVKGTKRSYDSLLVAVAVDVAAVHASKKATLLDYQTRYPYFGGTLLHSSSGHRHCHYCYS